MTANPPRPATQVINVKALDERGQLREGYVFDDDSTDVDIDAENCGEPSLAGVSPRTYACGASVFSADACWLHADGDLACLNLPWERQLSRRSIVGELPETPKPDNPQPLGLQLEDGSRYRQRNGPGGPGLPPEGFINTHYCVAGPCGDDPDATLSVLLGVDSDQVVSRDSDSWTVLVGELASDASDTEALSRAPEVQQVTRAWFVTAE